jgi:hypothetical protein
MERSYKISLIERSNVVPGEESSDWHDYVIAFGGIDTVRGRRQGNLKEVTSAVDEIVGQLNERHCKKLGKLKKT